MLRSVPHPIASGPLSCRTFVSSVLHLKSRDNKSIKGELRRRGLSQTGCKANLTTPTTEHSQCNQLRSLSVSSGQDQLRRFSTSSTPGIPVSSEATPSLPAKSFATKLPDLSQPFPEPPVQIPFVPDHWESSKAKPKVDAPESLTPKISTVTHATTYPGGGPSHNLYQMYEPALSASNKLSTSSDPGFWSGVANDLGLPTSVKLPAVEWHSSEPPAKSTIATESYSRKLDSDEVRGVWALLGLVAGSWILSGITKPVSELEHA